MSGSTVQGANLKTEFTEQVWRHGQIVLREVTSVLCDAVQESVHDHCFWTHSVLKEIRCGKIPRISTAMETNVTPTPGASRHKAK